MKKHLVWLLPVVAISAIVTVAYRPNRQPSKLPLILSSETAPIGRDHERKALLSELEKNRTHGPVLLRLAQLSRETGKVSEALDYLRSAVHSEPRNLDARLELGRVLFETGDIQGAIRETEEILTIDASHVDALYNLGAIYGNVSDDERARKYWQRAVALSPDSESGRRAKSNLEKLRVITN